MLGRYICGCIGMQVDSGNPIIIKPCDSEDGEITFTRRDMHNKVLFKYINPQDDLVKQIRDLIDDGYKLRRIARALDHLS